MKIQHTQKKKVFTNVLVNSIQISSAIKASKLEFITKRNEVNGNVLDLGQVVFILLRKFFFKSSNAFQLFSS